MAKVFLNSGESFTLANSAEVYGAAGTGTEKVLLTGAATAITTDQNIERVELSGNVSAYTFQVVGNQVKVYSGTTLVTTIGVKGDAAGTKVAFADGSADLKITGLNAATLGGQAVSSASATAITGATLNATDKSATAGSTSTTPGVGQAFTLTANATADVPQLTTGNDTITGAAGTLGSSDVLSDPSSTDSDTLNVVLSSTLSTGPTISNVEKINMDFKGFNLSYSATSTSKGTIVASTTQEYNEKATITGLASNGVNVEVGTGVKNLTLSAATANSGSTNLKLAGGDLALTTDLKTVGLNSTGTATNSVTLSSSTSAETLNVSGDQSMVLKVTEANLTADTVTKTLSTGKTLGVQITDGAAAAFDLKTVVADTFDFMPSTTAVASGSTVTFATGTTNLAISSTLQTGTIAADGTATTDVLNLTLNKSQGTLTTTGFETVNLTNSTGSALSFTTVDVGTSGALKFAATDKGLTAATAVVAKSIDTTAITAAVSLAGASAGTINTGAGADTITVNTAYTTGAAINAGDGANTITGNATGADTIISGSGNDTITATGGSDYVISGAGNDSVTIGSNNVVVNTLAGDDQVTISAASFGTTATLAGGDGVDTLNLNTAGTFTFGVGTLSGFESIIANTSGAVTITLDDSNVAANALLSVSQASTGALTLNGQNELDGSFNVVTGTGSDTIKTGAGKDTIVSGGGADSITAGKGADVINLTEGTAASDSIVIAAGDSIYTAWDQITGFTIGSASADILDLAGTAAAGSSADLAGSAVTGSTTGVVTFTDTTLTLDGKIAAVGAAVKTQYATVVFEHGGSTYVFQNTDTTSSSGTLTTNDIVVQLVGVTGATAGVVTTAAASAITIL